MPLRHVKKAFEKRPGRVIVLEMMCENAKRFVRLGLSAQPRPHLADDSAERLV